MYEIDSKDKVVELSDLPRSEAGAPMPVVLADDFAVVLAYYLKEDFDGGAARTDPSQEPICLVRFAKVESHLFGAPNDEAFAGHPLAKRGLRPYSAFRIDHSSWIRKLERMNSVHMFHEREKFEKLSHFVFSFHDSTFECVCSSFEIKMIYAPTVRSVIPQMADWL